MTRIETIRKIRALIAVAEHYRNAFYMPVPDTTNECIQEEIRGAVPYFSWFDGNTKFTACHIVKCKYNHIYARGSYTRDGKKTNLTAIKNSLKRLEKDAEENDKTVYRICRDRVETCPTKAPYSYTSEEFIDEYMNSTCIDYKVIHEFDNIDDALYTFNNTPCVAAHLEKTSYGYYFYLYEVLILQSIFYDDEGAESIEWLSKKASSINA